MGQKDSRPVREILKTLEEGGGSVSEMEDGLLQGSYDGHLDLRNLAIADKDARKLADLLRRGGFPSVKLLDLGNCSLSASGLQYIARGLYNSPITPAITRLNLSTKMMPPKGNSVGNGGAKSIAQLIEKCPTLREVHASCCEIESEGAVIIANALAHSSSLRILNLSYNRIRDQGACQIGLALKTNQSLEGLSLWSSGLLNAGAEGLAQGLANNNTLKWLGLGCNNIGNDGARALSQGLQRNITQSKLTWLALGNNNISDEGAEHLAELLAFGMTDIDQESDDEDWDEEEDTGAVVCPLQSLGLGGNNIGDIGASALALALEENTRLTSLGLSHNRIGDEGALELAECLRSNRALQSLVLSHNEIGTKGAETLVASLTQNRTLKALYLASNDLQDSVCERCIEVLSRHNFSLKTIDLHGNFMSGRILRKLLSHVETRQIPVHVLTGPLPSSDFVEEEKVVLNQPGRHISTLHNWQQTQYPTRSLFQGMSYAERVRSTLSSLPPPSHPPHPQRERRWSHTFHDHFEEIDEAADSGSDDSYCHSSEESTDSFEEPVHFSTQEDLRDLRSMREEARSRTSTVRTNPLFSGALVEGSTLSEVIAEPEEEGNVYDVMPLASFETKQQQNQGVRRFSKTTKREGVYNVEASYHHSIGGRQSSKLGVVELRPVKEVQLVSSHHPESLLVETSFDDKIAEGIRSKTQSSTSSLELEVVPRTPPLSTLTRNRVKPPAGRKPQTKFLPSSSILNTSLESHGSEHSSSLKKANREPSSQRRSSKVSFQLETPVEPKKTIDRKSSHEKDHSQNIQPSPVQHQKKQTRSETQLSELKDKQAMEEERKVTMKQKPAKKSLQGTSAAQPPAKQKKQGPKKEEVPLQEFSHGAAVDHTQLERELIVVEAEPHLQPGESQEEAPDTTTTTPRPTRMQALEGELSDQLPQSSNQQQRVQKLQQQKTQQKKLQKGQQQQEQEERSQPQYQEEEQQKYQRKQSQNQKLQAEQQHTLQIQKDRGNQKLHQQPKKQEEKQAMKAGKQQQQPQHAKKSSEQQEQNAGKNTQKSKGTSMQQSGHVIKSGCEQQPINSLQPANKPTVPASTSLQSESTPPVPKQGEEPLTLRPPLPVGAVVKTTGSGPSTTANLQEEEAPELEPISLDEIMPQKKDNEHEQLINSNQQNSSIETPETSQQTDRKALKEQWLSGLAKRVGIVKMGGFLHKAFESVNVSAHQYDLSIASLPCNTIRNRDGASLPPTSTRVRLQMVMEDLGSDYINASFVGPPYRSKSYIITQRPLENTVSDFWRMVWEQRCSVVVVLSSEDEGVFWPLEGYELHPLVVSGVWSYDALRVSREETKSAEVIFGLEKIAVTLQSTFADESENLRVHLLHYPDWPQNGIPEKVMDAVHLLHQSINAQLPKVANTPMVVMSEQGSGRAGCFCAVAVAYELIKSAGQRRSNPFSDDPNILDSVICGLRGQRPGIVANQQQFAFCHSMLHETLMGKKAPSGEEANDGEKKRHWKLFGTGNDKHDKKTKEKEKSKKQGKAKGKKLGGKKKVKLPKNLTPEDLTTLLF